MFTLKELLGVLDRLYGLIESALSRLQKQFLEFTLIPKPYLFRWGDAYAP